MRISKTAGVKRCAFENGQQKKRLGSKKVDGQRAKVVCEENRLIHFYETKA